MYDQQDYKELSEEFYGEPDAAATFLDNDDVAGFLELHGAEKGYECAIFKMMKSLTTGSVQRAHQITYTDIIPGAEPIVQQFGPGEYDWQLVTKNKSKREGGAKPITVRRMFIGPHWDRMHRTYQRAEKRREMKERADELREDAEEARIGGLFGVAAPAAGGLQLKDVLELLQTQRQAQQPTDPMTLMIVSKMLDKPQGFNWQALATILGGLGIPTAAGAVFNRLMTPPQPVKGPFDDLGMQLVTALAQNKIDQLSPPEPEAPWYANVVEGLVGSMPAIIATLGAIPAGARPAVADAAIKKYPKGPELLKALNEDPDARAWIEQRLGQQFDPASVEIVLQALRIKPAGAPPQAEAAAAGGGDAQDHS